MRYLYKLFRIIYTLYAFMLFIALMLPVFIWSVCVVGFGRIKGGNFVYRACMLWADVWFFLIGVPHRNLYEEDLTQNGSYIFVSNHISYFDVPVIVKTFRTPVRPLGKAEMAKIPVFGFIYRNAIVTVARSSAPDRAKSVELLKSVLSKGISILVFPEGTFNETGAPLKEFYDGAFRIAIETGTPIKPVLMLDTFDRMHYSSVFSLTPGRSRSIFLPQIETTGMTLGDVAVLKEKVYRLMEQRLRYYNASWIKQ